ncbi:anaphase-promoting complex, subunit 10-domain-containing protein [Daldinia loculata]|uniref:anaphase-promoting complex, subunit 10-domain-containing protein n=1 Tax=Daldinia loculata TaxID=103429 RepID=UPI0020C350DF|nr:anaphase-promoting complex, subunit 10-domain-containing protein [Daldinia loculata]KAI1652332.1 anaphase-promoting complex, subunit 10-domain-containing protein [Daldinia loculata]
MEPQDIGSSGGTARNPASIRQQQEEFRRRLMRPDRISRASPGYPGDPSRAGAAEITGLYSALNGSARRDLQWTMGLQTPQAPTEEDTEHFEEDEGEDDEGHDIEGIEGDEIEQEELDEEDEGHNEDAAFDASLVGLKEISNLASFTVSSYKPGCGVKQLRDDDVNQFWQSDGPQPHRLNIHFIKRVEIRKLRLYLDYELDESYTPTKLQITAGFSPNMTIPYTIMEFNQPKGWVDVPIEGAGGGHDGNSLCCWFIRVTILENHQNGKDTHIRGVEVYALDDSADTAENNPVEDMVEAIDDYRDRMAAMNIHDHDEEAISKLAADKRDRKAKSKKYTPGDGGLSIPDFMREPEIR